MDVVDCRFGADNLLLDLLNNLSQLNDLSSDDWLLWLRGLWKLLGQVVDLVNNLGDLLLKNLNGLSQMVDKLVLFWLKVSLDLDWFWGQRMLDMVFLRWDDWSRGSDLLDDLFNVSDLLFDLVNDLLQDGDLLLDDWSSLDRSLRKDIMDKMVDGLLDLGNLLGELGDLLVVNIGDVFLFWAQRSWSWLEWLWLRSWLRSLDRLDVMNGVGNLGDLLLQNMNLLDQSVDSLSDNSWLFWFWFRVQFKMSDDSSWLSSDNVDLLDCLSNSLPDSDDLLSDLGDLLLQLSDLLSEWLLLFWLSFWELSDDSDDSVLDLSDLSNQFSDDVSFLNNSLSQSGDLLDSLLRMETGKGWSDENSDLSVEGSQRLSTLVGHSSLESVASGVALFDLWRQG